MLELTPIVLTGPRIQLEPLNTIHKEELYYAAQDETIWKHNATNGLGQHFLEWFNKALAFVATGEQMPFVVRRLEDNKIVGSTRYYEVIPAHNRLSIGYTWYIPEVWGTHVNPECKFLLLAHAFEALHVNRVQFATDARNSRSRAALKKLGAVEEGTLRRHMLLDNGFVRDSVIFSILPEEWPQIKSKLHDRFEEQLNARW